MFTEYRQVNPSIVSDIRNRLTALQATIKEIDQNLNKDELWMQFDDLSLWETITDRVNEVSTMMNDSLSDHSSDIRDRVYQLAALTRSLQRSMRFQTAKQRISSRLDVFYLQVTDLNDRIGEFEQVS